MMKHITPRALLCAALLFGLIAPPPQAAHAIAFAHIYLYLKGDEGSCELALSTTPNFGLFENGATDIWSNDANNKNYWIYATPAAGYHVTQWKIKNVSLHSASINKVTTNNTHALVEIYHCSNGTKWFFNTSDGSCKLYVYTAPNEYTVTYNANGGSCSTSSKTVTYTKSYGTLATPTRTGYNFAGWYTAASGGSVVTSSTTVSSTSNHTIYAHWTPKSYTLYFNPNGGTIAKTGNFGYISGHSTGVLSSGVGYVTTVYDVSYFSTMHSDNPTRAGYSFNGFWTSSSGGSQVYYSGGSCVNGTGYWSNGNWKYDGNPTIYAHWTAKNYTVYFDANGGSCTTSSKTVTYDSSYGTLPTPSNTEDLNFDAWYTASVGGSKITEGTAVKTASNHTLYAHFCVCRIGDTQYPTIQAAINAATGGETISMLANSTESITVPAGKNVTLDLNGKVLKGKGSGYRVIYIYNNSTLTIADSDTTVAHNFSVDSNGLWALDETNGTRTIKGGVITGGYLGANPGGCIMNTGNLILNGGSIVGNRSSGNGGGIYTGTSSSSSSGCSFTMRGGSIIGNYAGNAGGGLSSDTYCTVQLLGGEIKYNVGKTGGGVSSGNTTKNPYTLGGDIVIIGNTELDNTTANNFYLCSNYSVSIATGDDAPKDGMSVGITPQTVPTTSDMTLFATDCKSSCQSYFHTDNIIYSTDYNANNRKLWLCGYKLTLNSNGADCSTAYVRTIEGSDCPTLPELTRGGFYSPGWYSTKQIYESQALPASSDKFTSGMDIAFSRDTTIYCWWKLKFSEESSDAGTIEKIAGQDVTSADVVYAMENSTGTVTTVDMTKANTVSNPSEVIDAVHNSPKITPNTLIYLPLSPDNVPADKAENVVTMTVGSGKDTTYSCTNFSVTDGVPVSVPYSFNADVATYRRDSSSRWGTVCVPFKLRSDGGIQYYTSGKLIGDRLLWEKADTVAAGCPAVYMVSDIDTTGTGGSTATKKDIVKTDYVKVVGTSSSTSGAKVQMVGTFTELVLDDAKVSELGLGSKDIYYYKDNKFYKRTSGQSVTIPALRAYIVLTSGGGQD